jgi:hypothetical protein
MTAIWPGRPAEAQQLYSRALTGDVTGALSVLDAHWRSGLRYTDVDPPEIGVYWLDHEPMLAPLHTWVHTPTALRGTGWIPRRCRAGGRRWCWVSNSTAKPASCR